MILLMYFRLGIAMGDILTSALTAALPPNFNIYSRSTCTIPMPPAFKAGHRSPRTSKVSLAGRYYKFVYGRRRNTQKRRLSLTYLDAFHSSLLMISQPLFGHFIAIIYCADLKIC
jgi:hypothetical protein